MSCGVKGRFKCGGGWVIPMPRAFLQVKCGDNEDDQAQWVTKRDGCDGEMCKMNKMRWQEWVKTLKEAGDRGRFPGRCAQNNQQVTIRGDGWTVMMDLASTARCREELQRERTRNVWVLRKKEEKNNDYSLECENHNDRIEQSGGKQHKC